VKVIDSYTETKATGICAAVL